MGSPAEAVRQGSLRVWRGGPDQILYTRPRGGLPGARQWGGGPQWRGVGKEWGKSGERGARQWGGGPGGQGGLTANLVLKGSCGHATSSMRGRVLGEG